MSKFRLTSEIIQKVFAKPRNYPPDGGVPELNYISVTTDDGNIHKVPTVEAHVFISGSGPIG
jgi:hypothetical protein